MANTLTWQPKALKQLEKIKDSAKSANGFIARPNLWLISRIAQTLKNSSITTTATVCGLAITVCFLNLMAKSTLSVLKR